MRTPSPGAERPANLLVRGPAQRPPLGAWAEGSFHSPPRPGTKPGARPPGDQEGGTGEHRLPPQPFPWGRPLRPIFSSLNELVTADLAGDEHLKLEWKVPMRCPVGARRQQAESREAPARSGQQEQRGGGVKRGVGRASGSGTSGPGVLRATRGQV